jgi:hypothetical protein
MRRILQIGRRLREAIAGNKVKTGFNGPDRTKIAAVFDHLRRRPLGPDFK